MSNWPGCSGFAEISPPDQRGWWGGGDFPAATIWAGSMRVSTLRNLGHPPRPASPSALRPATRMEPSLFQMIEPMNKDRLGYAHAPRDVRASVMLTTELQLYRGSKFKKKKERKKGDDIYSRETATRVLYGIYSDSYRFFEHLSHRLSKIF